MTLSFRSQIIWLLATDSKTIIFGEGKLYIDVETN